MEISTDILYLVLVASFTGLLWVPYVLNMIMVRGIVDAVGYPLEPKPLTPWAERLKRAHANAVENLVVFAALVLAASLSNLTNETTALACVVYFWTRVVHAVAYTFGVPLVRTLAFAVGVFSEIAIAIQFV